MSDTGTGEGYGNDAGLSTMYEGERDHGGDADLDRGEREEDNHEQQPANDTAAVSSVVQSLLIEVLLNSPDSFMRNDLLISAQRAEQVGHLE